MGKCTTEQRQVNGGTGGPLSVVNGGTAVRIFKNPGTVRIKEFSMQPEGNAHLQLLEGGGVAGGNPITAVRYVQFAQLWSEPGKVTSNDIYLQIAEAGVLIDCHVRFEIV